MGRYLLFLVAAASLATGAVFLNQGLDSRAGGTALVHDHLANVVAQRLSETGLAEATQLLSDMTSLPAATTLAGTMMGGTYVVTITPDPPSRVVVTSTAEVAGVGRAGGRHVREAVFELGSGGTSVPAVPAFLANALTIEQSLTMNQSQRVLSDDPSVNANVHTNGGSYVNIQDNAGIQGFYYSVTPPSEQWMRDRLSRAFRPNQNPEGLHVYQTRSRIEIPAVRASDFLAVATKVTNTNVQQNGGVLDFSGTSTEQNPAVWVVRGDFNLNGGQSLEVRGHVNLVTQGNVNIHGALQTSPGSALSIYSERDISINGTAVFTGSLMNNQNIQLSGGTLIHGPITTRGTVNFNGSSKIVYRPLSGYMTRPLFGGGEVVVEGTPVLRAISARG